MGSSYGVTHPPVTNRTGDVLAADIGGVDRE